MHTKTLHTLMLLLVPGLLLALAGCRPPEAQELEEVEEAEANEPGSEEAIKMVLLAETDTFFARDYDGWAATFVPAPEATQAWNNADGSYNAATGWETISANVRSFMDANPEPDTTPLWRENFLIRFYGNDAAFVTFDKYMGTRDSNPVKEVRVVEKHDGRWKIVCVAAFVDYTGTAG